MNFDRSANVTHKMSFGAWLQDRGHSMLRVPTGAQVERRSGQNPLGHIVK
jgi:hypothetical protein